MFFSTNKFFRQNRLTALMRSLMKDDAISGKLIIVAAALALIAVNSPLNPWYDWFIHAKLGVGLGDWKFEMSVSHWISEGLMTLFFLMIGLELKEELVSGELNSPKRALLPAMAAVGGMLAPALIFVALNFDSELVHGWAIPTATDVALAVGVLALLGSRVSQSARVFLLALAVVDDILAVIVIALFYSGSLDLSAILGMALVAFVVYGFGKLGRLNIFAYIALGFVLWILTLKSGVHPSIAGALLGLLTPVGHSKKSLMQKVESGLAPVVTLVVVPLFAFVSSGVVISLGNDFADPNVVKVSLGIVLGLVFGKFLGVLGTSWLATKLLKIKLPRDSNWFEFAGVAALAGIGFTVAIFVTELAYAGTSVVNAAKFSVLVGSVVSAVIGYTILRLYRKA